MPQHPRQIDGTPLTWVAPPSARNCTKRRGQRSSARGTGTTAAPLPSASPMSSSEKSNCSGEVVATRSSAETMPCRSMPRKKASTPRWLITTPFGRPVVPDVKIM